MNGAEGNIDNVEEITITLEISVSTAVNLIADKISVDRFSDLTLNFGFHVFVTLW